MSPESYQQFVVAAQRARRERAGAAGAARARRRAARRSTPAREAVGFWLVEVGLRVAVGPARRAGPAEPTRLWSRGSTVG